MILSVSYKPYLISQLSFDYICSLEILQHWPVSLFVTIHFTLSPFFWGGGQEYWSGLPFPSPGDLPDPEIKPGSSALSADALQSEPPGRSFFFFFLTDIEHLLNSQHVYGVLYIKSSLALLHLLHLI